MAFIGLSMGSLLDAPPPPVQKSRPVAAFQQSAPPLPIVIPGRIHVLAQRMVNLIIEEQHLCGFTDEDLEAVLYKAKKTLAAEPALLTIAAPLVVFGDIHGQLDDLIRFMTVTGPPPGTRMLFLGNYVNRCKKSLEVMVLLLCHKILHPEDVFLLRGNHETAKINRIYGLYKELKEKRNVTFYRMFNEVFAELPLCAVISGSILCMHGGLSSEAMTWDALKALKKPKTSEECDKGAALDLLWADPTNDICGDGGFQPNKKRHWSVQFDKTAVKRICDALGIDFICRAHETVTTGHQWLYTGQLVSIWSAPNYCGVEGNSASVMHVTRKLAVSFTTLKPKMEKRRRLTETEVKHLKETEERMQKSEELVTAAMTPKQK